MKKLFVVVVPCLLYISSSIYAMEVNGNSGGLYRSSDNNGNSGSGIYNFLSQAKETLVNTASSLSHYASKNSNPNQYVLNAQNEILYNAIIKAINDKNTDLRLTQFPDGSNNNYDFIYTSGTRVAERVVKLMGCIMTELYGLDPYNPEQTHKPDEDKLRAILKINALIVPDIYCAPVLRIIREQKNEDKKNLNAQDKKHNQDQEEYHIPDTGDIRADVFLYKFLLMPTSVQTLIINGILKKVEEKTKQATLEQKRALDTLQEGSLQIMLNEKTVVEEYCLNLPDEEFDALLEKRKKEKLVEGVSKEKRTSSPEKSFNSTNPFVDNHPTQNVNNRMSGNK
jgi:hypothetical protein